MHKLIYLKKHCIYMFIQNNKSSQLSCRNSFDEIFFSTGLTAFFYFNIYYTEQM